MIGNTFKFDQIKTVEFAVRTRDKSYFAVPVDAGVQAELKRVVLETLESYDSLPGAWEHYSVSEEYGGPKKLVSPLDDDLMAPLRHVFEMRGMEDRLDILKDAKIVDYYFAILWDSQGSKLVAIKQATRFKGILSEKGRLARLTDTTLQLIEGDVFRIEANFDLILDKDWVLVGSYRVLEKIADLKRRVAAAAVSKAEDIEKKITFVDFSNIKSGLSSHYRTAQLVVAISKRDDLHKILLDQVKRMAAHQKIKLMDAGDGRIRPRVNEQHKFLEIFDDRRYVSSITGEDIPFFARSRIKASAV